MNDFTYTLPFDENEFSRIIINELKRKQEYEIVNLLKNCKVSINEPGVFSHYDGGGRWNAYAIYIEIYVNPNNIEMLNEKSIKDEIKFICTSVIPASVGYDIKGVDFYPDYSIKYREEEEDLIKDLVEISKNSSKKVIDSLPSDLINKGFDMSEAYIYMYAIENTLRLFIEKVCVENYGENYFETIKKTKAINNKLKQRKKDAESKIWLSFNSSSDIFYLDFIELGDIIKMNWSDFKPYFPDQDFIIPKINEIADIRNRIAHNSYIGDTERVILKAYYNMILAQIGEL